MMEQLKPLIEAALFISGRWMDLDDLVRITGSGSPGSIKKTVEELMREYDGRGAGITIVDDEGRYKMIVSPELKEKVYYLAPEPELSPATLKTLALIAHKQPIGQSKVVEVIGNKAYDYIKELKKKGFIEARKRGRSKVLSTTGRFKKYFSLQGDEQLRVL